MKSEEVSRGRAQPGTRPGIERGIRAALADPEAFGRLVLGKPLRGYQVEPARQILRSVNERLGLTISVMFARQAGKNELSAQVECLLLNRFQRVAGAQLVKAAPTYRPQVINSIIRLERCLGNPLDAGKWCREHGYMLRLGQARALFFSAGPGSNVVGATASIVLEFDEAQDIDESKHTKDFLPMAATTNATRVYYGTAWTADTLLAKVSAENRERERADGLKRHFAVPWWVVAEDVPDYGQYVESEKARLGATHPLFRTQYALEEIEGGGRLFSAEQLARMVGKHARVHRRFDDGMYVAGVDVAGEDEVAADAALRQIKPRRDSTVVTIARLEFADVAAGVREPRLEVVDHYWWTGRDHRTQFAGLLDLLRDVWGVGRVCVDGTGVGAGVASFLLAALGESVCEVVQFSAARKSELGYGLLAAVNSGRLKVYQAGSGTNERIGGADGPEADDGALAEWWREAERCRYEIRGNQTLSFFVPEDEGHDDFVVSAALCLAAASGYGLAPAAAEVRARRAYADERW